MLKILSMNTGGKVSVFKAFYYFCQIFYSNQICMIAYLITFLPAMTL